MDRLPLSTRAFLLVIPLVALTLGFALRAERGVSSPFLEDGWNPFQAKSRYILGVNVSPSEWNESITVGRLIAAKADPAQWTEARIRDLSIHIVLKSRQYKLSPLLVLSLIHVESAFNSSAISARGAIGLMQLMPSTALELAATLGLQVNTADALADPNLNIDLALLYIQDLQSKFPTQEHMLTAYNIGPAALRRKLKNGDELPLAYYQKVMDTMKYYKREARISKGKTWL